MLPCESAKSLKENKVTAEACGSRTHMRKNPRRFSCRLRLSPPGRGASRAIASGLRSGLSLHRPPESPFRATLTHAPRYHHKNDSFCRKPAGVCTSRGVCSRSIGGCAGRNGRVSSLKLSAEMSPNPSPAWVQVWVQLKKEKWLPISRKRHQIGHLDFRSFRLLTDRL